MDIDRKRVEDQCSAWDFGGPMALRGFRALRPWVRRFGSAEAQGIVAAIEAKSGSGRPIRKDSALYVQLNQEVDRLRKENDEILAKARELEL